MVELQRPIPVESVQPPVAGLVRQGPRAPGLLARPLATDRAKAAKRTLRRGRRLLPDPAQLFVRLLTLQATPLALATSHPSFGVQVLFGGSPSGLRRLWLAGVWLAPELARSKFMRAVSAFSQSSARLLHATLRVLSLSSRDPAHPVRPSALPKPRSDRNANCGKHEPRTTNCNRQPQRLINLGNLRDRAPE